MASHPGDSERLDRLGVLRLRAENPGLLTLSGTNTWVVGCEPAWVIDPGPRLESHLAELLVAVEERGGLGGVVLTHDHIDHRECVDELRERFPAPLAAGRADLQGAEPQVTLREGMRFGPFEAVSTPGHASDHFALIAGGVCFTGDAVLGEGSVFIAPEPDALRRYLDALRRLSERELEVLCPGHGPPIWAAREHIRHYIEHRLERERRLLAALEQGRRTVGELLDFAWDDVSAPLRPAATVTLAAHLDKLAAEGRLPAGVERPAW